MARPITRHDTPPGAPSPRVRDFSGGRGGSARVGFGVRPAYGFVFSLSPEAGETDDLAAADRRWVSRRPARLGKEPGSARAAVGDAGEGDGKRGRATRSLPLPREGGGRSRAARSGGGEPASIAAHPTPPVFGGRPSPSRGG